MVVFLLPVVRLLVHPEFSQPVFALNAGFDASVMHHWCGMRVVCAALLGVGGSSMPSVGSLVPWVPVLVVC